MLVFAIQHCESATSAYMSAPSWPSLPAPARPQPPDRLGCHRASGWSSVLHSSFSSSCLFYCNIEHSVWQALGSPTSVQLTHIHSFLWLSNISLYLSTTASSSIRQWTSMLLLSWLSETVLQWTLGFMCLLFKCLFELWFSLGMICPVVGLLGYVIVLFLVF